MAIPGEETIAALATARGTAALAVVRMTGPEAVAVAERCFRGRRPLSEVASHTAHVGRVRGSDGEDVDRVVMTIFRAPTSPTGEDVVECTCHGGTLVAAQVLSAFYGAGARPAPAGAFTERAFVNGKIDLAQAEAVADLIHATSSAAVRVSLRQLEGRFSTLLVSIRDELLDLAAYVELELDFADEDVAFADRDRLASLLAEAGETLQRLLDARRIGALVRDGVRVTIAGRPNVGKSTLLNALAGTDRAIVSEIPGTTRDVLHTSAELGGLRFQFADTAGLRESADPVEQEGVRRAQAAVADSDAVLLVFDARVGLDASEERLLHEWRSLPVVRVANKIDLCAPGTHHEGALALSARDAQADAELLRPLESALLRTVDAEGWDAETLPVMVNARHAAHLSGALDAVARASAGLTAGAGGDTLAIDLRTALSEIGAITGAVTSDDILGRIFSRFCIGK